MRKLLISLFVIALVGMMSVSAGIYPTDILNRNTNKATLKDNAPAQIIDFKGSTSFRARDPNAVMINLVEIEPEYGYISGRLRCKRLKTNSAAISLADYMNSCSGRVSLSLRGFDEDNQKTRLRYRGEITKVRLINAETDDAIDMSEITPATTVAPFLYDIDAYARYVTIKKGRRTYKYKDAELEMTYDPRTNRVNVNSITGTLMPLTTTSRGDHDALSISSTLKLLRTYALGFH